MKGNISSITAALVAIIFAAFGVSAQDTPEAADSRPVATADSISTGHHDTVAPEVALAKEPTLGHFTWGAEIGSSVDLTGNDMTSLDLHAQFGYKGNYVRMAGIGAGINSAMDNSSRSYPVYAIFRSSFTRDPKFCFMDLRLGVVFNNILDFPSQRDLYGSLGIGFTLAKGKKFSSHIILAYTFMPVKDFKTISELPDDGRPGEDFGDGTTPPSQTVETRTHFPDLHFASIRIGCRF